MKRISGFLLLLPVACAQAASPLKAEVGVGWEYGIIGSQFSWQTPLEPLELFVAAGFDGSSESGGSFRGGSGLNLFFNKYIAVTGYAGMSTTHNAYNDDLEHDFGGSAGLKVFFAGKNKPGIVIGASYIYDGEEWSPLASIGYRF
ncbi:hypothetical protein [Alteromonas lipolytica]|uniref:Outer membrane protein beta-barrel domain-containing protein n=1 Tax=Alteromonas lipolytica TaxID=1856405 RepID=A0A1E8FB49_9ALTE|nr:hypothetical protein [Alteromonas lipolytica]OFI32723.1 hypothetical protein BFC17_06110 [Alteromonas lipolytica]GGF73713.1 hypothetical protein GCM10011338_27230 [Alteromonas lipolytica]